MRKRLSGEQVEQYRNDGYTLCKEPVFSAQKFAQLQSIFEENLARYGDDDLDIMHVRDPRVLDFLLADEVLDLVEPVVGPDIGLWSSHFISKPAGVGRATPWHEDSAYWNGSISTLADICTVWIALDKVDRENGCMKVIPGSHQNGASGFSEYEEVSKDSNIFHIQIKPDQVDETKAVYFELDPNECSLHEARIIHGADPNTSTRRRAGYTMRYFPTTSKVLVQRTQDGGRFWLARGEDRAGNRFENA
jgi:ectoine hydroxylase-related dioxygenase (phytanoyl-CoA dioxygenase family)